MAKKKTVRRPAKSADARPDRAAVERRARRIAVEAERARRLKAYRADYAALVKRTPPAVRGLVAVAAGANLPAKISAEGDSWFDYPPQHNEGVITHLSDMLGLPILNFAHYGDEARQMLGLAQRKRLIEMFSSVDTQPDALLFSGGGNDITGDTFVLWLNERTAAGNPREAINLRRYEAILDTVMAAYEDLRALRNRLAPACVLFIHAYDFAHASGIPACLVVGPWLKPALDARGWTDPAEADSIVRDLLTRFHDRLEVFAAQDPNGTILVPTQGALSKNQWANELHPTRAGFKLIAERFANAIRARFGPKTVGLRAAGAPSRALRARAGVAPVAGNGLRPFALHRTDKSSTAMLSALEPVAAPHAAFGLRPSHALDPETAARRFLDRALESDKVPGLTEPELASGFTHDFRRLGSETIELTGTTVVKFRQLINSIPVYGSLVTVELDENNQLLGIDSALGEPAAVSPITKISAEDALRAAAAYPGYKKDLENIVPKLNYYFDAKAGVWRLVFILEDVAVTPTRPTGKLTPHAMDYVVDAHSGAVVAELPITPTAAAVDRAADELNAQRSFTVDAKGAKKTLRNAAANITTYDLSYKNLEARPDPLPGALIGAPPPWSTAAVSAHANAESVSEYFRRVFKRHNIDGAGGEMRSTINCVVRSESPGGDVWENAYWDGAQMVYGQSRAGGRLVSLAAHLDIVGHEMFHGVTDNTSRLEYAAQSGALNESYSDIIGIAIRNAGQPNVAKWTWDIGPGLGGAGKPLRDMSNPRRCGQPDHMRDYRPMLPPTEANDYGGVHDFSGIHNKAAYNVWTARSGAASLFKPEEVAIVFYLAVTQRLSRTSQFSDSRRAVLASARTYFRALSPVELRKRTDAIAKAFSAVGIT